MSALRSASAIEAALDWTVAYTSDRKAFGRPVIGFQNTRFKLAEVKTEIALNRALYEKCAGKSWIAKYGEWDSFGVLSNEKDCDAKQIDDRVANDPLFTMNRAECLLALFLKTVEGPELETKGATVPDGSSVDFLDADREEVLLSLV